MAPCAASHGAPTLGGPEALTCIVYCFVQSEPQVRSHPPTQFIGIGQAPSPGGHDFFCPLVAAQALPPLEAGVFIVKVFSQFESQEPQLPAQCIGGQSPHPPSPVPSQTFLCPSLMTFPTASVHEFPRYFAGVVISYFCLQIEPSIKHLPYFPAQCTGSGVNEETLKTSFDWSVSYVLQTNSSWSTKFTSFELASIL